MTATPDNAFSGMSSQDAAARMVEFGPNELAKKVGRIDTEGSAQACARKCRLLAEISCDSQ